MPNDNSGLDKNTGDAGSAQKGMDNHREKTAPNADTAFANLAREYNTPGTEPQRAKDTQALTNTLESTGVLPGLTIDGLHSKTPENANAPVDITMHTNDPANLGKIVGQPQYDPSTHTVSYDRTSVLSGTKSGTNEKVTVNMITGQEIVEATGEDGTHRKSTRAHVGEKESTTEVTDDKGTLLRTEKADKNGKVSTIDSTGHFIPSEISPNGVDQLALGDCWFQSAVASMAGSDNGREQISQMIKVNPDGNYTVTFPGDKNNPVTVSQDEANKNGKIADGAEWARVLEAAVLKVKPQQAESGVNGAQANKVGIELLTGENVNQDLLFKTSDQSRIAATIEQSIKSGTPITASSRGTVDAPMLHSHVYTVTNYDPSTGLISVRNPWGHNDEKVGTEQNGVKVFDDGTLQMSMDTFLHNYESMQYQGQPKSTVQRIGQLWSDTNNKLNPFNW